MSLAQFAAGWLGWSQSDAMATDVNYVVLAYDGRVAMLQALFGSSQPAPKRRVTAEKMKAFAIAHNALWKSGRMRKG